MKYDTANEVWSVFVGVIHPFGMSSARHKDNARTGPSRIHPKKKVQQICISLTDAC